MSRVRRRRDRRKCVRFGAPDVSLTDSAGVVALAELVERLAVVEVFDEHIGAIKQRDRGVSAGQLLVALAQCQLLGGHGLVALAQCQLLGGHGLVALDRQRADLAAGQLSAIPGVPATTAASLARRFGPGELVGIEAGPARLIDTAVPLLPAARQAALTAADPTIDMDSTDVEVYGSRKDGVAYNFQGQRAGRPHLATWAEAGLTLAAELLAGNQDVRPGAAGMLRRPLAALPDQVNGRPRLRADAGYFTAELAHAADEAGCDNAIAAKRNMRCGAPMPASARTSGATRQACPARRWPRSTTPPRAGPPMRT